MARPATQGNWLAALALALGALGAGDAVAATAPFANLAAVNPVVDCAALTGADISKAVGAKVTIQSAKEYPGAAAYCGVKGEIAPHVGFEVRLPVKGWTQRYVQLGCGGLCGVIGVRPQHVNDCTPVVSGATVMASTDMGHSDATEGGGVWAKSKAARVDFAYRGVHLTALASKALIARYYGRPARYAYFSGCSDGGREAMMEAQRFPDDFDGITAGAPVNHFLAQNTFYHGWQAVSNTGPDGKAILTSPKLPALHRAAVASCDEADGLKDGQISDPRACRFDPAAIQCRAGAAADNDCLTAQEVEVARKFYAGPRDAAGHRFTLGGPQVGSELAWRGVYVPDTPDGRRLSPVASLEVLKYVAFAENPSESYSLQDLKFDLPTFDRLSAMHPLYDSTDPNLTPFEKSGGKLLMWHGWSDPHISPINTIAYYQAVERLLGPARTRTFARLFMFPGLYHCGGGDGPVDFDVLTPLMTWVETGRAPDQILASRVVGGPPQGPPAAEAAPDPNRPPPRVDRMRPVYPYPLVAKYAGKGSIDAAASFTAAQPARPEPRSYDPTAARFIGPIRR